jgi:hypothetical protein
VDVKGKCPEEAPGVMSHSQSEEVCKVAEDEPWKKKTKQSVNKEDRANIMYLLLFG